MTKISRCIFVMCGLFFSTFISAEILTPELAAQREGETVTLEFKVKGIGWNPVGYDELYSEQTWDHPKAFFIRFPASVQNGLHVENAKLKDYVGRKIRVTGQVQTLNFGTIKRKAIYIFSKQQIERIPNDASGRAELGPISVATPPPMKMVAPPPPMKVVVPPPMKIVELPARNAPPPPPPPPTKTVKQVQPEKTARHQPRHEEEGLNQAQIDAMERQRQLMWNATGAGMIYR